MPNWCSNSITLRGSSQAKVQRLADAFREGKFCSAAIPIPEELQNPDTGSYGGDNAEEKDRLRESLVAKYGFSGWYDFCTNRWGTKWDVGDEHSIEMNDDGLGFRATFDSAWAPPTGVYEQLVEDGFEVVATYYESGMGFIGRWDNGCDDYYELSGLNSQTVRDEIGEDLDDEYGISESMAEYESENEEELTEWIKEGKEKLGLKAL